MSDPYAANVKLLLLGEGANNGTTFVDSSPLAGSVTVAAGSPVTSTTQFKYGAASIAMPSTSAKLSVTVTGSLGSGDFAIEAWVYPTSFASTGAIFTLGDADFDGALIFYLDTSGVPRLYNHSALQAASTAVSLNQWTHVAVVRASGVITFFVGGTAAGTGSDSHSFTSTDYRVGGGFGGLTASLVGYIDELRVTVGVARYTTTFTPPATLDPGGFSGAVEFGYNTEWYPASAYALSLFYSGYKYGAHTTWSLSCEDSNGFAYATEDKGAFDAIYLTYGAANSNVRSRWGNTSILMPASSHFALPAGSSDVAQYADFSLEMWVFFEAYPNDTVIVTFGAPTFLYIHEGKLLLANLGTGTGTTTVSTYAWHHLAVVRSGNIIRVFLDGNQEITTVYTGALSVSSFGGNGRFYMDSIGFSNNYAHYTGTSFTVANQPFYVVPSSEGVSLSYAQTFLSGEAGGTMITPAEADGQWSKTALLLRGNGSEGSTLVSDARGHYVINENVTISSAESRHVGTSMFFNGSNSRLTIQSCRALDPSYGDFSFEFWFYPTAFGGDRYIAGKWGDLRSSWLITQAADGTVSFKFWDRTSSTTNTIVGGAAQLNAWNFFTVTRTGNDYRIWVNGILGETLNTIRVPCTEATRMYPSGGYGGDERRWDCPIVIGALDEISGGGWFAGYLEDYRFTNGYSRQPLAAGFPVPTQAFLPSGSGVEGDAYWPQVVALLHLDEPNGSVYNIRDAKGHAVTVGGDGYVSSAGMFGGAFNLNTTGYLSMPYGSEFDLTSGDFTIEMWFNGLENNSGRFFSWFSSSPNIGCYLNLIRTDSYVAELGYIQWTQYSASGAQDIAISQLDNLHNGRWIHLAVVRSGDGITIFMDGVPGSTTTITRRPGNPNVAPSFSVSDVIPGVAFMDDIRWTRAARYTTAFVPSFGKYPEQSFSYGNAVIGESYHFLPASPKAASTVPGAIFGYRSQVAIPKVFSPTIGYHDSIYAPATAKGGEGGKANVGIHAAYALRLAYSLPDGLGVADYVSAQDVRMLSDGLGVNSAARATIGGSRLSDGYAFDGASSAFLKAAATFNEGVGIHSVAYCAASYLMQSTLALHGANAVTPVVTVAEALALLDSVTPQFTLHVTLADGVGVADVNGHVSGGSVTDGLGVNGVTAKVYHGADAVAEGLGVNATAARTMRSSQALMDGLACGEAWATQQLLHLLVGETLTLSNVFSSPAFTAWVMNTRTTAVSQYDDYRFNSFAQVGARYVGACETGLYWLDGADDAGLDVIATIQTPIVQPNGNKLASVDYAYIGMRGEGAFTVTVVDEAGNSYDYELDAASMRTERVKFGRGLRTRYFTFKLVSSGQDFDMDSVEFVTRALSRKLQR